MLLFIFTCVCVLGVVVNANIDRMVHIEYIRRRQQLHGQPYNEIPTWVHAGYVRYLRQQKLAQSKYPYASVKKSHDLSIKNIQQHYNEDMYRLK